MRIKENFKVRNIAGENLIVNQGASHADLTKIISLNPTSLYLWESLSGKDFTAGDAADLLTAKFEIDLETALKDAEKWINILQKEGIIA